MLREKLHFTDTKPRGDIRRYYICLGKPTYNGPLKQRKAVANKKFAFEQLTYPDRLDKELQRMIVAHINASSDAGTTTVTATATTTGTATNIPTVGRRRGGGDGI